MVERLEVERRRPGVVDQHGRAVLLGDRGDRVDVLHLEGLRAGRLEIDDLGVGLDQLLDAGADHRIEEGRLDAEALERGVGEAARRTVAVVGQQHVVAGLQEADDRAGDRGEARLHGDRAIRALDRGDRVFQCLLGRRAVAAVAEALERHAVLELLHGRGEDGRGVIDGRIDDAEVVVGIAAGDGQNGVGTGISFLRGHDSDYGTAVTSAATGRCPAYSAHNELRYFAGGVRPMRPPIMRSSMRLGSTAGHELLHRVGRHACSESWAWPRERRHARPRRSSLAAGPWRRWPA